MPKVNDPTLTASSASRMFRYSKSIFCLFELFCSLLTLSRNSLIRAKVGKFALSSVMASATKLLSCGLHQTPMRGTSTARPLLNFVR